MTNAAQRLRRIGVDVGVRFTAKPTRYFPYTNVEVIECECVGIVKSKHSSGETYHITVRFNHGTTLRSILVTSSQIDISSVKIIKGNTVATIAKTLEGLKNQATQAQQSLERAQQNLVQINERITWCEANGVEDFDERVFQADKLITGLCNNESSSLDVAKQIVATFGSLVNHGC